MDKSIHTRLKALEEKGKSIRIASRGSGWMGSGFIAAVRHVPGMEISVLCDEGAESAKAALLQYGGLKEDDVVITENIEAAARALENGKRVVTEDPGLAARIEAIDIITDVTPSPASGAETAYLGMKGGKDVVIVNIEADVTVGRALKQTAKEEGVLYTVSSGDEPGCLMELWDFVRSLGYEPIVIGKGKNNPLNVEATPDTVRESAEKADKDPFQVASYVDGTKTMFEMTCVANATGCLPVQPGMIGPEAGLAEVSQVFALKSDGGLVPEPGAVDFVQGPEMSGGVFITVRVPDERICADLNYLKVGKGNYFTFFRPYHLWFLEAPISIARAYFDKAETLVPLDKPAADVAAIAKKDLKAGEILDAFGGYCFHGRMHRAEEASRENALPVGLAPGAVLSRDVKKGGIIRMNDVKLDEDSVIVKLRRNQDKTSS